MCPLLDTQLLNGFSFFLFVNLLTAHDEDELIEKGYAVVHMNHLPFLLEPVGASFDCGVLLVLFIGNSMS